MKRQMAVSMKERELERQQRALEASRMEDNISRQRDEERLRMEIDMKTRELEMEREALKDKQRQMETERLRSLEIAKQMEQLAKERLENEAKAAERARAVEQERLRLEAEGQKKK